ncbi:hypothetical protein QUB68_05920 [Microcoleus sp. A006_D1]|uniref:hypothetical protein n=1 Tax=Microcoleus sp. A006_D1 TaxID=3055267 RepID=UPI002FCF0187
MTSLTLLRDLWSADPAVDRPLAELQVFTPGTQPPNPTATAWNLSNVSTTNNIHSHSRLKVGDRRIPPKPTQFSATSYDAPRLLYH